ncbi:MAG: adenylate/guanylate cyclase domain-containing protein [Spirochaetales bacterium]
MFVVLLGDAALWPEVWRAPPLQFLCLASDDGFADFDGGSLDTVPDLVVLDQPGAPGFLALLNHLKFQFSENRTRLVAWSGTPSPREVFVCHNAGLLLLHPGLVEELPSLEALPRPVLPGSPRPEALNLENLGFALSLHQNLTQSFLESQNPTALFWHLRNAFSLVSNPDILVFILKDRPQIKATIFSGPGLATTECDYFLRFCQQDFLGTDRFVDLESMEVEYLEKDQRLLTGRGRGALSSYWFHELKDPQGTSLGTVHSGSFSNQYFTPLVERRLSYLAVLVGPLVGMMQRGQQLSRRFVSLRALFGKFLPDPVVEKLLAAEQDGPLEEGRKQELAILFSDIRGFTSITERNGAEAVVGFLNRHFDAMVTAIVAHGGVVDKFIGDAIVAVFGINPLPTSAAEAAARAARAMMATLNTVDLSGLALEGNAYRIGIGLHFGEVVLGYLGSDEKTSFTVIGKAVETAELLESSTKLYHVDILASGELRDQIQAEDLAFIDLGKLEDAEGDTLRVYTV